MPAPRRGQSGLSRFGRCVVLDGWENWTRLVQSAQFGTTSESADLFTRTVMRVTGSTDSSPVGVAQRQEATRGWSTIILSAAKNLASIHILRCSSGQPYLRARFKPLLLNPPNGPKLSGVTLAPRGCRLFIACCWVVDQRTSIFVSPQWSGGRGLQP
jgi:hypothetical protein